MLTIMQLCIDFLVGHWIYDTVTRMRDDYRLSPENPQRDVIKNSDLILGYIEPWSAAITKIFSVGKLNLYIKYAEYLQHFNLRERHKY
jgi:hypothetical protein